MYKKLLFGFQACLQEGDIDQECKALSYAFFECKRSLLVWILKLSSSEPAQYFTQWCVDCSVMKLCFVLKSVLGCTAMDSKVNGLYQWPKKPGLVVGFGARGFHPTDRAIKTRNLSLAKNRKRSNKLAIFFTKLFIRGISTIMNLLTRPQSYEKYKSLCSQACDCKSFWKTLVCSAQVL